MQHIYQHKMFALGARLCENKLDDIRATTFHLVGLAGQDCP